MRMKKANNNFNGVYFTKPQILKFKTESVISDEDMMHLFMGFVRLIKRSVELDIENKYLTKIKSLENEIKLLNKG